MTMRARFGVGLGAGLLLGLLIVGSTALYPSGQTANTLYAPELPPRGVAEPMTTASSVVTSISSVTTAATTTFAGPSVAGANSSYLFVTNSSIASLTNSSGAPAGWTASIAFGSGGAASDHASQHALLASQVDNIGRQPLFLSVAALLPVVAAVLFGAIIYRVSRNQQDEEASHG